MRLGAALFVISILVSVVLLNPSIRNWTTQMFSASDRKVLSQMGMQRDGRQYQVVKVRNAKGLAVEVYAVDGDLVRLLDRQELTDKKDAHYRFGDKKYNLLLKDINNDGSTEIVLPTLDKNMKARLNVFIFDGENEKLVKVTKH